MKNKNLNDIKQITLTFTDRVFENPEGISLMFGDTTKHYSWFPGPGEIRLNVKVKENELAFTVDSISLSDIDLKNLKNFQDTLNEIWIVVEVLRVVSKYK